MITIRPVTPDEVDVVRSLAVVLGLDLELDGQVLTHRLRVAMDDAVPRVEGFMVWEEASDHLLVETVAVRPEARDRGVGSQLLLHAQAYAVTVGLREVRLRMSATLAETLGRPVGLGYGEPHVLGEGGLRSDLLVKGV